MRKNITRIIGNEFCTLEVELTDTRLSICGSAGYVTTPRTAKREALDSLVSTFDDNPEMITDMNRRCGTWFRSSLSAAKYVIAHDGDYHGQDVRELDAKRVLVLTSCGQIREEIGRFFPEVTKYYKWHLNDMKAECVHQEARGENWTTHPSAKCTDCGYVLGSAWLKRDLPPEVIAWFTALVESES